MCKASVIIAAAGSSRRMSSTSSKQLMLIDSKTVLEYSLDAFSECDRVSEIIIVTKAPDIPETQAIAKRFPKVKCITEGGKERFDSVSRAFGMVSDDCDIVAIHDAARPLVTVDFITQIIDVTVKCGAVCPVSRVTDTVKISKDGKLVDKTPDRNKLFAAQTPQCFKKDLYKKALDNVGCANIKFTDDSSIVEAIHPVTLLENPSPNIKITHENDLDYVKLILGEYGGNMKIGHGYDVHRLCDNRALILGGVKIDYAQGLLGHSDADVLVHAVMDALIGATGLGDIGKHFPDTDPEYKGISSIILLEKVRDLILSKGYTVTNIDATIIAQKPKLLPYIPEMKKNIASALNCDEESVNVKATTEEGLGFTGDLSGISAHAVALIKKS